MIWKAPGTASPVMVFSLMQVFRGSHNCTRSGPGLVPYFPKALCPWNKQGSEAESCDRLSWSAASRLPPVTLPRAHVRLEQVAWAVLRRGSSHAMQPSLTALHGFPCVLQIVNKKRQPAVRSGKCPSYTSPSSTSRRIGTEEGEGFQNSLWRAESLLS